MRIFRKNTTPLQKVIATISAIILVVWTWYDYCKDMNSLRDF